MSDSPTGSPSPLPPHAPAWAEELARAYVAGAASVFLLHGNLHDLVGIPDDSGELSDFVPLESYLAGQVFGQRGVVLQFDRGGGIEFLSPGDEERRKRMRRDYNRTLQAIDLINGTKWANSRPTDPKVVFELLDKYILHRLYAKPQGDDAPRGLAIVIRYLETIVPAVDASWLTGELGSNLLKVLNWANDPAIREADVTICLLTENLADLNRRLVENPFIAKLDVPLPTEEVRRAYAAKLLARRRTAGGAGFDADTVARESNGLSLVGLQQAIAHASGDPTASGSMALKRAKKKLIEKQCFGLIEFIEPRYDLDMVVAPAGIKDRLQQDARLHREGRYDTLPMGYLLCGPIGTGKTFTATCFAGTMGIPALVFKNLRDRWVGSSEGNMQKVLSVVRALGPVVVIVDEADAALGSRAAGGDSGTSSRMFAMVAAQMSDTHYRGRILWMLLTCRPDLIPVDLKRQGRAEVHIPLFPPETEQEQQAMLIAMARKNGVTLDAADLPPIPQGLSGADIESVVVQSRRRAALENLDRPELRHIEETLDHFVSPDYGIEREIQELVAIRECTDVGFLPERLRSMKKDPVQAAELTRRLQELRKLLRH